MTELKPYPAYKDSGVEWIGETPKCWDLIKLKYLCHINTGSHDTQDKASTGKYPFFVRSDSVERINEYTHDEEAVMTAGDGVGVGKVFHYYKGKFSAHQRVYLFTNFKNSIGKFLYYYLSSNLIFEVMQGTAKSTVDSLRRNMLTNFIVSIPNKENQKKITQYLDQKTSQIDSLITNKEQLIELLEEKRQAVIIETVTKGLDPDVKMKDSGIEWIGEIPKHWKVVKLKRYLNVQNGREIDNELELDNEKGINVYGSGGVFKKTDKYLYDGESVLFGRKGTIGKPLYVNEKFWTVDTMLYTDFYNHAYPRFFYYVLKTFPWEMHTTQTALPSIVGSEIENEYFVAPSYNEQALISESLDRKLYRIGKLETFISKQIEKLKEYRKSIVYEAVTGKVNLRKY